MRHWRTRWWGFFCSQENLKIERNCMLKKKQNLEVQTPSFLVILFQPGRHLLYLRLTPLNPFFMCSFNFLKVKSSSVSWRVLTSKLLTMIIYLSSMNKKNERQNYSITPLLCTRTRIYHTIVSEWASAHLICNSSNIKYKFPFFVNFKCLRKIDKRWSLIL